MRLGQTSELVGEILGNTASSSAGEPTGPVPPGGVIAEAPTGEIAGSFGIAYVVPSLRLSLGLSVDNNGAFMFRPGFTVCRR